MVVSNDQMICHTDWSKYGLHICSENNFPTAAGLASSASGFSCLVYALAKIFDIKEQYPGELSVFSRIGSGSACRSIMGGWVKWVAGTQDDGKDSIAIQVADDNHWPEIEILVVIFSSSQKPISSTEAMKRSVDSSQLLHYRAENIVPIRIKDMENAIIHKDFTSFAKLTIQESNQFHAICLDTYPPIQYLNDHSKGLINLLTTYNQYYNTSKVAYTFDAGPNAVIYTTRENLPELTNLISHYFPPNRDIIQNPSTCLPPSLLEYLVDMPINYDTVQRIIYTKPGPGPQVLLDSFHLIDASTGLPYKNN